MKTITILSAWSILWAGMALAEPPALVRSELVNGAINAPMTNGVQRFHFDQDMDHAARTFSRSDRGQLLASLGTGQDELPAPTRKGRNPLGVDATGDRQPAAASGGKVGRPPCPQGWTDLKNPTIGMQAYVPGDYWVRLRGGLMLTVD
jgi:hypothetical protein